MTTRYPGDPYTKEDRALARSVAQEYLRDLEATCTKDTRLERRKLKTRMCEAMLKKYVGIGWFGDRHAGYMIKEYGGLGPPQSDAKGRHSNSRPRVRRSRGEGDTEEESVPNELSVQDGDSPLLLAMLGARPTTAHDIASADTNAERHEDDCSMEDTIMVALSPFPMPHAGTCGTTGDAVRRDDSTSLSQSPTAPESAATPGQSQSLIASPTTPMAMHSAFETATVLAHSNMGEATGTAQAGTLSLQGTALREAPAAPEVVIPRPISVAQRLTHETVDENVQIPGSSSGLELDILDGRPDAPADHDVSFRAYLARRLIGLSGSLVSGAHINDDTVRDRSTPLLSSMQLLERVSHVMDQTMDQHYANLRDVSHKHFTK